MRYFLTSLLVVGVFATALYLRGDDVASPDGTPNPNGSDASIVLDRRPDFSAEKVEGGTELVVRYRFAGSCSRAKVVYRHEGKDKILASTTNCRRALAHSGKIDSDGYVNEVELSGKLPDGASDIRLVLESETGTRIAPVEL